MKLVGNMKSSSAVNCTWSPDGRQLITAVLFPRLRIENNFKVFYYSGINFII